ncbi:hypothetical protein K9M41_00575 [Candidatus Gracilibacteria bacterium]|nr:hypothetical protein [Candidatus Gracilibacteria bacterium]
MEKAQSSKLAVIGNESSVLIFRSLGTEVYAVGDTKEAQEKLQELVDRNLGDEMQTPEYAIIFVEENFYQKFPDDLITKLAKNPLPAVIPVPSPDSKDSNFSAKRLSKIVERAVGSDILS